MFNNFISLSLTLVCVAMSPISVSADKPSVLITEVFYTRPFTYSDHCNVVSTRNMCSYDKWLEITNFSDQAVDLRSYSLVFGKQKNRYNFGTYKLDPKQSVVIYNEQAVGVDIYSIFDRLNFESLIGVNNLHFISKTEPNEHLTVELWRSSQQVQAVNFTDLDKLFPSNNPKSESYKYKRYSIEYDHLYGSWNESSQISLTTENQTIYGSPGRYLGLNNLPESVAKKSERLSLNKSNTKPVLANAKIESELSRQDRTQNQVEIAEAKQKVRNLKAIQIPKILQSLQSFKYSQAPFRVIQKSIIKTSYNFNQKQLLNLLKIKLILLVVGMIAYNSRYLQKFNLILDLEYEVLSYTHLPQKNVYIR